VKAAVVREIGSVGIEDIPEPVPNEYQAVTEVLCWATCNSTDYRAVHGTIGWNTPLPFILGHETVGRVVCVGSRVRNYQVGDILLRVTAVYPGSKMGQFSSALGSFAEVGLATDTEAMKADDLDVSDLVVTHFLHQRVPADMDPADACMIINLRESLSWVKALQVEGKSVLIIGDGPVGQGFVQTASVRGAKTVILVGHHDERLQLGRRVGAEHTINSKEIDYLAATRELTDGEGVDILVDCVGDQRTLSQALSIVKAEGKVAAYGSPKIPPTGPKPEDPRIVSIRTDEAGAHGEILKLIEEERIDPRNFYSERMDIAQIDEAIRLIGERRVLAKVVLDV